MDDQTLIQQILKGQHHAFLFLVNKYQNLVLHMVSRMVARQEDVEDICQEVFIKVFSKLKTFKHESKLSTWIASIAYRVCLNHLRKEERQKMYYTDTTAYLHTLDNNMCDVSINIERKELKQCIVDEIEKLPIQYRTLITLYHLEEFSYKEIENITGIKIGTIKSYLARARAILKEKLKTMR